MYNRFHLLFVVSALACLGGVHSGSTLDDRSIPVACNICQGNSTLINGDKEFTMSNGLTWTCEYLQETVQDVDENGNYGEARMCRQAQLQAEWGACDCVDEDNLYDDDDIDAQDDLPLTQRYTDPHDACNMCAHYPSYNHRNGGGVPESKLNALVSTGIFGTQSCGGLHHAMMEGILSANYCLRIQRVAGPVCCQVAVVAVGGRSTSLRGSSVVNYIP